MGVGAGPRGDHEYIYTGRWQSVALGNFGGIVVVGEQRVLSWDDMYQLRSYG